MFKTRLVKGLAALTAVAAVAAGASDPQSVANAVALVVGFFQ